MSKQPYCYEPCTRDQALVLNEDEPAYWVHVPTGEIYRYLMLEPKELPRGAEYVRPMVKESK
jgi:hypothetical protein